MNANTPARMETQGRSDGEISEEAIAQRAEELARIDGRKHAANQDRFRALEELSHPGPPPPPEADETVEKWSEAAASHGHQGPHVELEDEQSAAEQLVNEGIEEADHEQRLAASDDLPEE